MFSFNESLNKGAEAVILSGAKDGGGGARRGSPAVSAAARIRAAGDDFSASFVELQEEVREACRRQVEWEAKVVAGIHATLEFAANSPGKALALTVHARRPSFGDRNPEQVVIAHFAGLLGDVTPAARRLPVSTDESIVESAASMVRGHLLAGTEGRLPGLAPDVVYLTLLPYLGLEATKRWAQPALSE
jgi:hypothetical protein